jgi:tRNA(Ile2)-agmatinylcytidine synthase
LIKLHLGVDDVDSIKGGCTTHYATILAWTLRREGYVFADYLNLVRLNPAIPWKTRGNGAVAIRLYVDSEDEARDVFELAKSLLAEYIEKIEDRKRQPVLVSHLGDVPGEFKWLAEKALHDVVPVSLAERALLKRSEVMIYAPSGMRGVIGALAAIGYEMVNVDYTYELLAYRAQEYWGTPRRVDVESIIEVDRRYRDSLILTYDEEYERVLATPRGPDPVLLGLRGEDPLILLEAFKEIKLYEPVEYLAIYRTNQHTDAHLKRVESVCEVRPYTCIVVKGVVSTKPRRIVGGHVIFTLCSGGCCVDVATYEPTKRFRDVVQQLEVGDVVEVMGCTRPASSTHGVTINLEKINIVELADLVYYVNPKCPRCGSTMESAGRGKGFRCRKCGYRDPSATKIPIKRERGVKPGLYEPPKIAFKHLMKPASRIGREKRRFEGVVVEDFVVKLL